MRHLKLFDEDRSTQITIFKKFIELNASMTHKLLVINHIVRHAPSRQRFILVGDSGELDPEVKSIASNTWTL
jgi:phosphatidate phosphatase APP1